MADLQTRRQELLEALQGRLDGLVAEIVARVQPIYDAGPAHDPIPAEELAAAAGGMTRVAVSALLEPRPPSDGELALAAQLGEARARQGVTLETLLRGLRVGARVGLDTIGELSVEVGLDTRSTIEIAATLWDWIDDVSVEVAEAHRRVELSLARRDQQQRASFVHGLISGTLTPQRIAAGASAFKLAADAEHVVVRARPTQAHSAEAIEHLLLPSTWSAGLTAVVDEDVVAILPAAPTVELPVAAGIGPALPLAAMSRSFALAGHALATAVGFGLVGVHALGDLSLRAAVLADDHVGDILVARYLDPLRELGHFGDELLHSLRVYMECHQAIDAAAQRLHVHYNTLRHRLARFEEITGANLRDPAQLAEVWWALARADLEPSVPR